MIFLDDLVWLVKAYFRRFKYKADDLRYHLAIVDGDIRLRGQRIAFSILLFSALPISVVFLLSNSNAEIYSIGKFATLFLGVLNCTVYVCIYFWGKYIKAAAIAYVALFLPIILGGAAVLTASFTLSTSPFQPLVTVIAIIFAVYFSIPSMVVDIRDHLKKSQRRGKFKLRDGFWDPQFEMPMKQNRVGCVMLGLMTIAYPFGYHFRSLFGKESALILVTVVLLFVGGVFVWGGIRGLSAFLIVINESEKELNSKLLLPEYKNETARSSQEDESSC